MVSGYLGTGINYRERIDLMVVNWDVTMLSSQQLLSLMGHPDVAMSCISWWTICLDVFINLGLKIRKSSCWCWLAGFGFAPAFCRSTWSIADVKGFLHVVSVVSFQKVGVALNVLTWSDWLTFQLVFYVPMLLMSNGNWRGTRMIVLVTLLLRGLSDILPMCLPLLHWLECAPLLWDPSFEQVVQPDNLLCVHSISQLLRQPRVSPSQSTDQHHFHLA